MAATAESQPISVKVEEKVAASSNGSAAAAANGSAPVVDKAAFWKRLKVFFDQWKVRCNLATICLAR